MKVIDVYKNISLGKIKEDTIIEYIDYNGLKEYCYARDFVNKKLNPNSDVKIIYKNMAEIEMMCGKRIYDRFFKGLEKIK